MSARRILLAALLLLLSSACFAPQPRIVRQKLNPPEKRGNAWLLAVTVENQCRGEGEAQVTSRLRDAGGAVVAEESREIDLKPHETVTVTLEFHVAGPGPFTAASEVQAPPS
jgi:uncharacterized protein (DUF58 family)